MGKRVLLLTIGLLVLDQILKIWVKTHMEPGDSNAIPLIGDFFRLNYVENQGMAFGTTLSDASWGKLALSLFRLVAVVGIAWYLYSVIKKNESRKWFVYAIALVFVGALGNLIDGIFYDLFFLPLEEGPAYGFNYVNHDWASGELRPTGAFRGTVVDMFQLYAYGAEYPEWVPWLGGSELFPFIFNLADVCITFGVIILIFTKKDRKVSQDKSEDDSSADGADPESTDSSETGTSEGTSPAPSV